MTPAQALLAPIAIAMFTDFWLTCIGISRRGFVENNPVADAMIKQFGLVRGLSIYQVALFSIFTGAALLFPSQWAFQAMLLLDVAICIAGNLRLLKLTHKGT